MSSPASSDHAELPWAQRQWRNWRARAHDTFADRRRRLRLIRTTAIWTALAVGVGVFAYEFSWDWFKGPIARYAAQKTGRPIQILGHLDVRPFSWTPSASVGGLVVGNPKWMGGGQTANLGRTTVQLALRPLLGGRLELPLVDIERPTLDLYADKSGRNNWTLGKGGGQPAKLPAIQRFVLHDGQLRLRDLQRGLSFDGTVTTVENAGAANAAAFRLVGKGALNGEDFLAEVTGGPLMHIQRDRPYPFRLDVRTGPTHVVAQGDVVRPFDFGQLRATAQVTGKDMADLYDLTGVVFPNTPAYRLSGDFTREDQVYRVRRFAGRVGRSDLEGTLSVQPVSGRRFLKGDLTSRALDLTDLGALFGGAQAGKPAAVEKAAVESRKAVTGRLLPDAPLDVQRVRAMDADVRYRAQSVKTSQLPLRQVALHVNLNHGLLKLDPVAFTFPHGQLHGRAAIDARGAAPVSRVDLVVTDVRLEDVTPKAQGAAPLEGVLEARAQLTGSGNSVHRAAAASNGQIAVALPPGKIRQSFAELTGVNLVPGLFQFLSKSPKQTDLRCAVAQFDVNNGVMSARRLILDTGPVLVDGSGKVNLQTETIDLTMQGHGKKPRLLRVIAPFHIQGRLAQPTFKVETGKAIAQTGAAVGLGVFLFPPAVILPFLSPGGAHNADCAALLAEARSAGAPVKATHIAAAQAPPKKG